MRLRLRGSHGRGCAVAVLHSRCSLSFSGYDGDARDVRGHGLPPRTRRAVLGDGRAAGGGLAAAPAALASGARLGRGRRQRGPVVGGHPNLDRDQAFATGDRRHRQHELLLGPGEGLGRGGKVLLLRNAAVGATSITHTSCLSRRSRCVRDCLAYRSGLGGSAKYARTLSGGPK